MMTNCKPLCARASASAIAAAVALSPIHANAPKPIVDLSKSPALSGEPAPQPAKPTKGKGPVDEQTLELGGGAIVLLSLGTGAFLLSRRRKHEEAGPEEDAMAAEPRDPLFDEPMFNDEATATKEPSAFAWGNTRRSDTKASDNRGRGESWVERAYRGPTPENPSLSLRRRLKRAAFFDKRDREAAAGTAAHVQADAGLPEALDERELEAA